MLALPLDAAPYAKFYADEQWDILVKLFKESFYALNGLGEVSTLEIALKVRLAHSPQETPTHCSAHSSAFCTGRPVRSQDKIMPTAAPQASRLSNLQRTVQHDGKVSPIPPEPAVETGVLYHRTGALHCPCLSQNRTRKTA